MYTTNAFIKNLLIAGFTMLLPLMGLTQEKKTNSNGTLLFQSGFEPGTKVVHSGNGLTGDDDLIGTDISVAAPNDWVKDIDENGNLGYFNLQYQGGDSTMRAARIIADPTNPNNHVLSFRATQPNVGEASKTRIQANIYAGKNKKTEGIKDFYQSIRIYLPRDMETLEEYPDKISWLTILEVWNNIQWVDDPYPYRITLGMGKPSGDKSRLHFMIDAEDYEYQTAASRGRYIKIWEEMNLNFDIPYEKWVTLEYYIREGEGANGRFYMTATVDGGNKEVIFDIHNYMHNTRDPKPDGITLWNPMKLYTSKELTYFMKSKGKALQVLWDDFSIWKNRIPPKSVSVKEITDISHPRILLFAGEEETIRKSVNASAEWKKMHEAILTESDRIITLPPVERIQIGRRLLDKSREALRRIFQLSYAYRMTGENKYLARAEKELLAVSNFTDWNPSHFLDVAEMTMAVSIGYDWLYNALSESSRKTIREAIVTKGLELSKNSKYNSWLRAEHNWNQVCNAGMTYGALAVAEDHPELAKEMIEKAIHSIVKPMDAYNPDGAYPEGYGYWGYGTSFNTMFLSAVEKVFRDDFGLLNEPGYLKTGGFLQHMTGTTNLCFNWGDCGLRGGLNPTMFWLAQRNNDPTLLWVEKSYLGTDNYASFTRDRLLPAVMIWGKDFNMNKVEVPKATAWMGLGANPVAMMRTSWTDPSAIYLGFKAGSASVNHGHMDIGSFIMESDGIRWASDFGSQDYESLESKGFALFGRTQDAQRWTVFRLNNRVHNTLTVNDQLQLVKGFARIDKFSADKKFMFALSDISSVYGDQLGSAKRGAAIVDSKYVVIRDELTGGAKKSTIRWTMLTTATPEIKGNTIILTKDGKKLTLRVEANAKVTMKTWSTEPTTTYDAPNPGSVLVGFEFPIEAGTKEYVEVYLVPGKEDANTIKFNKALQEW